MPNDAKLGLVVGVGLVIAVAVLFFRKDPAADPAAATSVQPVAPPPRYTPPVRTRPVAARSGVRTGPSPVVGEGRSHTVREGDTLFSLAKFYYGDPEKSAFLFEANRGRLSSAGVLPPGTVLVIPDLPAGDEPTDGP
jgi:nucleoid-associated protein YgaU